MTKDFAAKKNNRQNNQREQLSPQEWAEQKQLEKEALYQQIDSTAEEISENPDKLKSFLDLQARMDRYSPANALLIFSQLPEATRIKDFSGWGEDNVRLKKGVKGISILEPVEYTKSDGSQGISYNVKKMFDVSQTNGKKQPAPTLNRDTDDIIAVMVDTSPVNVELIDEMPQPGMGTRIKPSISSAALMTALSWYKTLHRSLRLLSFPFRATATVAEIWDSRLSASVIWYARSSVLKPRALRSTVFPPTGRIWTRRLFAPSCRRCVLLWARFILVFPMSFTDRSRSAPKTARDKRRCFL